MSEMRFLALIVLLVLTTLSVADCGCGAKCSTYSDASKCTRCCTATVKRSLPTVPRRSHRFLLPQLTNPIRIPMWLAASSYAQSQPTLPKRHNRLLIILMYSCGFSVTDLQLGIIIFIRNLRLVKLNNSLC
ncbi:unnamed protein product [Heligmosomoides polygyrus]|uniref:Secreted protein n=1 Tax=Heligmosomoides polygyrus TaxID=6339 RepID=A0A183FXX6_HELPZ|nr:unnamed protein product [Heligmosomoides polygyrus]